MIDFLETNSNENRERKIVKKFVNIFKSLNIIKMKSTRYGSCLRNSMLDILEIPLLDILEMNSNGNWEFIETEFSIIWQV